MNSIKTKKVKLNYIVILVASVVAVALSIGLYYYFTSNRTDSTEIIKEDSTEKPVGEIDYSAPTSDQQNPATDTPVKDSSPSTPSSGNIVLNITALNQNDSTLQVRLLADGLLPQGTCSLQMSKAGEEPINSQVDTFVSANSTTCKGFDVDVSAIEKGVWNLVISMSTDGRSGNISREIEIK